MPINKIDKIRVLSEEMLIAIEGDQWGQFEDFFKEREILIAEFDQLMHEESFKPNNQDTIDIRNKMSNLSGLNKKIVSAVEDKRGSIKEDLSKLNLQKVASDAYKNNILR